jgi:hypothetical protein
VRQLAHHTTKYEGKSVLFWHLGCYPECAQTSNTGTKPASGKPVSASQKAMQTIFQSKLSSLRISDKPRRRCRYRRFDSKMRVSDN